MTIYIYDPQIMPLGENILSIFFKKRASGNMSYLLEMIKEHDDVKIFTDYLSTYAPIRTWKNFPLWLRKLLCRFDLYVWCIANKVPLSKINSNVNKLDPDRDIVFAYGTVNGIFENDELTDNCSLKDFLGKVMVHLNHYFTFPEQISRNCKKFKQIILSAETQLWPNSFYQKFFKDFGENYVLPFAYRQRFEPRKDFEARENKVLALGTYLCLQQNDPGHSEVIKHFQTIALQPIREAIYLNKESITEQIDCIISKQPFEEDEEKNKKAEELKGLALYIFKLFAKEQKKYFSLDIVDQYNKYKMVITGEETIGLPSIVFPEVLACRSAYIGIDSEIYSSLGLEAGKHYISYDGSLEDLINKIKYYQEHGDELEVIAEAGYQFAKKHFSSQIVKDKLYQDLYKSKTSRC